MPDMEIGKCDVCGANDVPLNRKYYRYNIKCSCCSPRHFEVVHYCNKCEPREPKTVHVVLPTDWVVQKFGRKID